MSIFPIAIASVATIASLKSATCPSSSSGGSACPPPRAPEARAPARRALSFGPWGATRFALASTVAASVGFPAASRGESMASPSPTPLEAPAAASPATSPHRRPAFECRHWAIVGLEYAGVTGFQRSFDGEPQQLKTASSTAQWPFGVGLRFDHELAQPLSIGPLLHVAMLQTDWGTAVGMAPRWLFRAGIAPTLRLPYTHRFPSGVPKLFYVTVPVGVSLTYTPDEPDFEAVAVDIHETPGHFWGVGFGALYELAPRFSLGVELGGRTTMMEQTWTLRDMSGQSTTTNVREQLQTFYVALTGGLVL